MINVIFGTNEVAVLLKDRITIDPVFLIMRLQSTSQTDFIKVLKVTDQASADCKASKIAFELVNEVDEDLPNGKVYLFGGNYNYEIFESAVDNLVITGKKLLDNDLLRYDTNTIDDETLDAGETEKTLLK